MDQSANFWPMLALMGWTFLVLVQVPIRRFRALCDFFVTNRVDATVIGLAWL